jgi:anaerobic ribonucleoside-triphosphate reductase
MQAQKFGVLWNMYEVKPASVSVVKADMREEKFNGNKIVISLIKAGVDYRDAARIADEISGEISTGKVSTSDIKKLIAAKLALTSLTAAAQYEQKQLTVRTSKGELQPFNSKLIAESLVREAGVQVALAQAIAEEAERKLRKMKINSITAPLIRETVNGLLLEHGLEDERKLYARLGMPVYDVTQIIERGIKENANLHHNPETIHKFAGDAILKGYLFENLLPQHLVAAHFNGAIHIHDADYFAIRPNCLQHDLRWFFKNGLKVDGTGKHTSSAAAPKHALVAALQAAKVLAASQTNMAGGQALENFNIFMAPYLRGMPEKEVKQVCQAFVYEMNMQYVARGGQTVFSNVGIELTVPKYIASEPAIKAGKAVGVYADYEEEAQLFTSLLLDVFLEGDAAGKPHLFPNLIVKVRPSAFTNPAQAALLFKVHQLFAKYGTPYILNLCPGWQHDAVNSMGCRTRLSGDYADKLGLPTEYSTIRTGNMQYVTINLPRLALEAPESDIFTMLDQKLELVRETLELKHDLMDKRLYQNKILPFLTQRDENGDYYRFDMLTHTAGFCGLNEFVRLVTGSDIHESLAARNLALRTLKYMRDWADDMSGSTGWRWTLTQSPAESASGRMARADLKLYGQDALVCGNRKDPNSVYYTNSSHIKVDADIPLFERGRFEGETHKICNGGHITHLFLGEANPDPTGLMKLTEGLCKNTQMGLFDYTRDLSACNNCNHIAGGLLNSCPVCGGTSLERYSRITGYCQNVAGFNDSKLSELRDRKRYRV